MDEKVPIHLDTKFNTLLNKKSHKLILHEKNCRKLIQQSELGYTIDFFLLGHKFCATLQCAFGYCQGLWKCDLWIDRATIWL